LRDTTFSSIVTNTHISLKLSRNYLMPANFQWAEDNRLLFLPFHLISDL
jgi:hypothetical protein